MNTNIAMKFENIPSKVILVLIAVVTACMFSTFVSITANSQKSVADAAMSAALSNMDSAVQNMAYSAYDNTTVTGAQVVNALKELADTKGVVISVDNGVATTQYANNASGVTIVDTGLNRANNDTATLTADGGDGVHVGVNSTTIKNLSNANNSNHYITQTATFNSTLNHGSDGITHITFSKR